MWPKEVAWGWRSESGTQWQKTWLMAWPWGQQQSGNCCPGLKEDFEPKRFQLKTMQKLSKMSLQQPSKKVLSKGWLMQGPTLTMKTKCKGSSKNASSGASWWRTLAFILAILQGAWPWLFFAGQPQKACLKPHRHGAREGPGSSARRARCAASAWGARSKEQRARAERSKKQEQEEEVPRELAPGNGAVDMSLDLSLKKRQFFHQWLSHSEKPGMASCIMCLHTRSHGGHKGSWIFQLTTAAKTLLLGPSSHGQVMPGQTGWYAQLKRKPASNEAPPPKTISMKEPVSPAERLVLRDVNFTMHRTRNEKEHFVFWYKQGWGPGNLRGMSKYRSKWWLGKQGSQQA